MYWLHITGNILSKNLVKNSILCNLITYKKVLIHSMIYKKLKKKLHFKSWRFFWKKHIVLLGICFKKAPFLQTILRIFLHKTFKIPHFLLGGGSGGGCVTARSNLAYRFLNSTGHFAFFDADDDFWSILYDEQKMKRTRKNSTKIQTRDGGDIEKQGKKKRKEKETIIFFSLIFGRCVQKKLSYDGL